MKVIEKYLFALAILTSSFDIAGNFDIGFNLRLTQIFTIVGLFIFCIRSLYINKLLIFKIPVYLNSLFIWIFFIIIFTYNTPFLTRSIGYVIWMMLNLFIILWSVNLFKSNNSLVFIINVYTTSFFLVSIFGLIQFLSPLLGVSNFPYIQQWWIPGLLPRINGFSYEPSFYATYLILGYVTLDALYLFNYGYMNKKLVFFYKSTILLSVILSSSRMGILILIIWYFTKKLLLEKSHSNKIFHIFDFHFLTLILLLFFITILIYSTFFINTIDFSSFAFLAEGLGLFGTSAHSVDTRTSVAHDTFMLFVNSPFIGYSLGGVASNIALQNSVTLFTNDVVKEFEGNSVFVEVLAASGLIGFMFFINYFFHLIYRGLSIKSSLPIKAFTLALIFELLILQFNQNILRTYLWIHIAILSTLISTNINDVSKSY